MRLSIHDLTAAGAVVYSETHTTATTNLGLFNLNIGSGTPIVGTLAGVIWGVGAKFIQVEMDPTSGVSYIDMGTSQLNSVPYALFSGQSGSTANGTLNVMPKYAGDASTPTVVFYKIMGNQAGFGSGLYFQDGSHGKVSNTLISGNKGIGGVYNNTSNPMFTNVTFGGNGGYNGGIFNANSQPFVKNSIIWGNSTPVNDTQSIITYSTVQSGYAGVGNLAVDPKYVSPMPEGLAPITTGDYHLQAASLAIDRGDNGTISLTDLDLDGNLRRFSGGRVDMGAYEFQGVATTTLVISVVTGPWEANSTWDVGRVPQLGDYVIIDSNPIVTLTGTGIAKNLEYRGTGQLKFNTNTSKLEIGF